MNPRYIIVLVVAAMCLILLFSELVCGDDEIEIKESGTRYFLKYRGETYVERDGGVMRLVLCSIGSCLLGIFIGGKLNE